MTDIKYVDNITLPNGDNLLLQDRELTIAVSTIQNKVETNTSNISNIDEKLNTETSERKNVTSDLQSQLNETNINIENNANAIKTNQTNILTNTKSIGENSANILTNKTNISTNTKSIESINSTLNKMIDTIYPIGSIYLSMTTTNPQTLFGVGTWERIKDRFLLGCGDSYTSIGIYGGEETHTLTVDELPPHSHTYDAFDYTVQQASGTITSGHAGYDVSSTSTVGGGQPHNNMPPYVTCYIWKRVS